MRNVGQVSSAVVVDRFDIAQFSTLEHSYCAVVLLLPSSSWVILFPSSPCRHTLAVILLSVILLSSSSCGHSLAVILLSSSFCRHPLVILLPSSSFRHPLVVILLSSYSFCHPPVVILLSSSSCRHPRCLQVR